ncbi:MAG TPA: hypothetical protein VMT83_14400 [Burkholderiaceae bacterium]|nr:hypothetical protein [Burkholderiaceae bacterium]
MSQFLQATRGRAARLGLSALGGLAALAWAAQAAATCHVAAGQQGPAAQPPHAAAFAPAVFHPADAQATFLATGFEPYNDSVSIVGLWEFEVRASMDEGPFRKGDLLDWGLATWHDDGTEIQFSAGRPYDAGDVCMGVWKQTGRNKFHLNHIALGKDLGTGANFDGLTNIRADVTVGSNGNRFTGSYLIIQYYGSPVDGTEFDQSTEQYRFVGVVTATRVSPN